MSDASVVERPRGTARREALVRAALQIVGEIGPDALTHRRVAEAAGLPLASTTYWFSSKEELLTAAFELAASEEISLMRERVARLGDQPDPVDAIVALVLAPDDDPHRINRASMIAAYALYLEAARHPWLRELSSRWTGAYLDSATDILTQAGVIKPRLTAELVVAAADGLLIDQLARGRSSDLRPRLRTVAKALIKQKP
jgi:DNA-binding transcriptional regulator YbjK